MALTWQGASPALAIAVIVGAAFGLPAAALAHDGHDHGAAAAAAETGATPRRLADGTLYVPKARQRLLGIRTITVRAAELPLAIELAGRLVADPNASARITAERDGRIEPADKGLPHLGQAIAQGETIAHLVPTLSSFEDSQLRQKLTEIERELALLLPRSEHLGVVNPNMPMGDTTVQLLQEMQIQAQALSRQGDLIKAALGQRIPIEAPIAGTVSDGLLVRVQSVMRGQTLIELVDRSKALAAVHRMMRDAHDAGAIGKVSMRELDEMCLVSIAEMSPAGI